jgi:hypothetical protein
MKNNDTVGHGNPSLEVVVPKESLRIDILYQWFSAREQYLSVIQEQQEVLV